MMIQRFFFLASLLYLATSCGGGGSQSDTATSTTDEQPTILTPGLVQLWASDTIFRTPESVLYYDVEDVIFVANINQVNPKEKDGDGFISKLGTTGETIELKWATGLNDPKGMGILNGLLYVTDIGEIAAIDLGSGEILRTYPADGAQFLNDITVDVTNGIIYATDSYDNKLYRLMPDGDMEVVIADERLDKPNGLLMEADRLLLLSMSGMKLYEVDPDSFAFNEIASGFPGADGIVAAPNDSYLVSNWNGEVYLLQNEGEAPIKLLDTKDAKINAADIDYVPEKSLLLVPTFYDNRVVAYEFSPGA